MTSPPLRPHAKLATDLLANLANLDRTRLTPEAVPLSTTVVEHAVRVEFHTGEPITVTAGTASAATVDSMVEHYRWLATHNGSLHGRMVAAATVVTRHVTRYATTYTSWEPEADPDA